ncbi:ABC transporter substrate-binding protein [Burkholderia sp. 22PA0106]|uniref:ABC transporter substrate-binding protein n=1 Tax=Burkholderia sp. 22PA0106 TaxID=3237371 RepID=UPI0039C0FF2B
MAEAGKRAMSTAGPSGHRRQPDPARRRLLHAGLAASAMLAAPPAPAAPAAPAAIASGQAGPGAAPRIATLDWTVVETLLALGVTPVAAADAAGYRRWVGQPPMPDGVTEIGLRTEPNLEALVGARPDLIVITPQFERSRFLLERIGAVRSIDFYPGAGDALGHAEHAAATIADWCGRPRRATALITEARRQLAECGERVAARKPLRDRPLLIAQFADARHLRLFGAHSLFDAVLARLGLRNAWSGSGSPWGSDLVPLTRLAAFDDAALVHVAPLPGYVRLALRDDPLWRAMPFVRARRVIALPACWPFGGVPSALHFATRLLAPAAHPDDILDA